MSQIICELRESLERLNDTQLHKLQTWRSPLSPKFQYYLILVVHRSTSERKRVLERTWILELGIPRDSTSITYELSIALGQVALSL